MFIILAGALLVLGGAGSLIAGFDIVMTERGSAMTIAGTIALSGGVIALGIGFSLLRLSQILGALEAAVEEPKESENEKDNTVVPSGAADQIDLGQVVSKNISKIPGPSSQIKKEIAKPATEEDTILVSPLARKEDASPPKRPGFLRSGGLAATGLVAAGAAVVASVASAKADQPSSQDDAQDLAEPQQHLETVAVETTHDLSGLDLDAALSKALAEDITPLPFVPKAEPTPEPEITSFNEGLSQILSKPRKKGKKDIETPVLAGDEDQLESVLSDTEIADSALDRETALITGDTIEDVLVPEIVEKELALSLEEAEVEQENSSDQLDEGKDILPIGEMTPKNSAPTILGTYNAGDGTYIMYSDGTVEAITEQGVTKFKSMDDLRAHLSKA